LRSLSAASLIYYALFELENEELITARSKLIRKNAPMKTIGEKSKNAKSVYDYWK